jgi:hypothetical protein
VAYANIAVQNAIVDIYIGVLVALKGCEVALQSLCTRAETPPLAVGLRRVSDNEYLQLVCDLLFDELAPLLELGLQQVEDHLDRGFLTRQIVQLGPVVLEWLLVIQTE